MFTNTINLSKKIDPNDTFLLKYLFVGRISLELNYFFLKRTKRTCEELCEFNPIQEVQTILYRASEHGFNSKDFHSKCDGHANTLTILKSSGGSSFIFGGFTSATWDSLSGWKADSDAFLFSLTNKEKLTRI